MILEMEEDEDDEAFGLFKSAEQTQKVKSNSATVITSLHPSSITTDDDDEDDDWGNFISSAKPPPTVFSSATPSRDWKSAFPAILSLYEPVKPISNANQWRNCVGFSPPPILSAAQKQEEGTRIDENGGKLFGSSKSFNHVNKLSNLNELPSLNSNGNSRETTNPRASDGDAKVYSKSRSFANTDRRLNANAYNMIFTDFDEQKGVGDVLMCDLEGNVDEIGSKLKSAPLVLRSRENAIGDGDGALCSTNGHCNNKHEGLIVNLEEKMCNGGGGNSDFSSDSMNLDVTESISNWKSEENWFLNMAMTKLDLACNPSINGLESSLAVLNVDQDTLKSSAETVNSHINGREELCDDLDVWEFQCAETKDDSIDDISKDNKRNILPNMIQNGVESHESVNLVNLDPTFAENEDFVNEQEWEFKAASSQSSGQDALQEGGSGSHCKNCLFGLSEGSSHKSYELDSGLMINAASLINIPAGGKPVAEGNNTKLDNQMALPLSFFGDEEERENDDLSICQEFPNQFSISNSNSNSNPVDGTRICSHASFSDLILSLYGQSDQKGTAIVSDFEISNDNDDDDDDDDSWEFKVASVGSREEDCSAFSATSKQVGLVDFFSNLKGELHFVVLHHLEILEKAQSDATLAGEVDNAQTFSQEIVDLRSELHKDGLLFSGEDHQKKLNHRNTSINELTKSLQEPYLQLFDSEYQICAKLLSGENDWRLEIETFRNVAVILKILSLASREDQCGYVWVWSKMLSLCVQELDHGAHIWNRSLKQNIHIQMLSNPQGRNYIIALGEIYRIVEVIAASVRLYKPWILACAEDPMGIISPLSQCSATWWDSGLEEALGYVSDLDALENGESVGLLRESIKRVRDLDVLHIHHIVFSCQEPICRFSLLNPGVVPGMKTVTWNGNQYFLALANFWANLVNEDPPNLPTSDLR